MGLFSKKEKTAAACGIQTERTNMHPFSGFLNYIPLNRPQFKLYSALREAVPIIDAAILKLTRLTGGFSVACSNKRIQNELEDFLTNVNVGGNQQGIEAFVSTYFEELLTYGTAVGEIVVSAGKICGLYNASLDNLQVKRRKNSLDMELYKTSASGEMQKIKYPQLILFSALNPCADSLAGNSMLSGMPFITDILMKIYNTIGVNWERIGNLRFAVNYKPSGDFTGDAQEIANEIASQWSNAMSSKGAVKDFVSVGDVSVKVIGADNQILDSDVPVRQMLEQIVAKTGLPPFMLGLSWSSTERMSFQQADVLTSELEAYRRILTPVIGKIVRMWMRFNGYPEKFEIVWDDITLQDQVDISRARLYNAQAEALERNSRGEEKN